MVESKNEVWIVVLFQEQQSYCFSSHLTMSSICRQFYWVFSSVYSRRQSVVQRWIAF